MVAKASKRFDGTRGAHLTTRGWIPHKLLLFTTSRSKARKGTRPARGRRMPKGDVKKEFQREVGMVCPNIKHGKLVLEQLMISQILGSLRLSLSISLARLFIFGFLPHELRNDGLHLGLKSSLTAEGTKELRQGLVHSQGTSSNIALFRVFRVSIKRSIAIATARGR